MNIFLERGWIEKGRLNRNRSPIIYFVTYKKISSCIIDNKVVIFVELQPFTTFISKMTRLILHIELCQEKSVGIKFNNLLSSIKSSNTISPTFIKRNLKVENKKLFLKLTCSNLKSLVNLRSCPLHMKLQVLHLVRLDYANSLWTLIKDVYQTNES